MKKFETIEDVKDKIFTYSLKYANKLLDYNNDFNSKIYRELNNNELETINNISHYSLKLVKKHLNKIALKMLKIAEKNFQDSKWEEFLNLTKDFSLTKEFEYEYIINYENIIKFDNKIKEDNRQQY